MARARVARTGSPPTWVPLIMSRICAIVPAAEEDRCRQREVPGCTRRGRTRPGAAGSGAPGDSPRGGAGRPSPRRWPAGRVGERRGAGRQPEAGVGHPGLREEDQAGDAEREQGKPGQLPRRHGAAAQHRDRPSAAGLVRADDGPHRAESGDRRLLRLHLGHPCAKARGDGLAKVILGLGQDPARLCRPGPQARAELAEVLVRRGSVMPSTPRPPVLRWRTAAIGSARPPARPPPCRSARTLAAAVPPRQPTSWPAAPSPPAGAAPGRSCPPAGRRRLAALPERHDDRVAVSGSRREHRQQQQIEVPLKSFSFPGHASACYA